MSEKPFKASNGIVVTINDDGYLLGKSDHKEAAVTHATGGAEYGVQALREFFRHERDQELGRVRWPENPDYVIYRIPGFDLEDGRCVRVTDERTGRSWRVWENVLNYGDPTPIHMVAAHWFFAEGPGKAERPWEDAKVGEVWRLTVDGYEGNFLFEDGYPDVPYFFGEGTSTEVDSESITAGRKIVNADGSVADG